MAEHRHPDLPGLVTRRPHLPPAKPGEQVLVAGLGRFGGAVAAELGRLGMEVLGIDNIPKNVQYYADLVTHVVEGDATDVEVLRQLGVGELRHAVVGIGSDIEASILTTAALDELGVPGIWAKAVSATHGRILERVGAHHVIHPEHDMGHRVAHLVGGRVQEWFQIDEDFAIVETTAPGRLVGRSLAELDVRAKHHVTVVFVKAAGGSFTDATPDTVLERDDVLLVAGSTSAVEAFARLG